MIIDKAIEAVAKALAEDDGLSWEKMKHPGPWRHNARVAIAAMLRSVESAPVQPSTEVEKMREIIKEVQEARRGNYNTQGPSWRRIDSLIEALSEQGDA